MNCSVWQAKWHYICAWKSSVQTRRRNVQLLVQPSTAVPHRPLCQCPTSQHGSIFDPLLGVFLVVPRCRLSTLGPRAFSVAGLLLCNCLPDSLRDPDLGRNGFRVCWRCIYLHCTEAFSILEMFHDSTLYWFTYTVFRCSAGSSESFAECSWTRSCIAVRYSVGVVFCFHSSC